MNNIGNLQNINNQAPVFALDTSILELLESPNLNNYLSQHPEIAETLIELTKQKLQDAYQKGSTQSMRELQQTLYSLYQPHLAEPLSVLSENQFNPTLLTIRQLIEEQWLKYEEKKYKEFNIPNNPDTFVTDLRTLWTNHIASHHPLFDFLETEANRQQIFYFFKSDSSLNLLFFDLVAMTLVGSRLETRGEISRNLWDEIGEGSDQFTHVNLYKDLLARTQIGLADDHYGHLLTWQGLTGYNAFMLGSVNRKHYFKAIGVMAMTELLDPPQYEKLVKGCHRIGLTDRDVHYYTEHIEIDIVHADGWLNNVIKPIVKKTPAAIREVYLGSVLRLQTANDYYDHLLVKLQEIK